MYSDHDLVDRLKAAGLGPRRSGGQWMARCPCHEDRTPSLSATVRDGRVLVYCHAGCPGKAILAALGLLGAARPPLGPPRPAKRHTAPPTPGVGQAWRRLVAECPATEPARHEAALGIPAGGLVRLGAVWSVAISAIAAPMYAKPGGALLGVRYRGDDGRKWAERGGHNGLFCPTEFVGTGPLYLPEGLTDTAALLGMGLDAVGRPCVDGGRELVKSFANGRPLVVVSQNDGGIGARGAARLAGELKANGCYVRVLPPPPGVKDVREWARRGADAAAVLYATAQRGRT